MCLIVVCLFTEHKFNERNDGRSKGARGRRKRRKSLDLDKLKDCLELQEKNFTWPLVAQIYFQINNPNPKEIARLREFAQTKRLHRNCVQVSLVKYYIYK